MALSSPNKLALDYVVNALKLSDVEKLWKEEENVISSENNTLKHLNPDEGATQSARGAAMVESDEFRALLKDLKSCSLLVQDLQPHAPHSPITQISAQLHYKVQAFLGGNEHIPLHYFCGYHSDADGRVDPFTVMKSLLVEFLHLRVIWRPIMDDGDLTGLNNTPQVLSASMTDIYKVF
ncbi:MAG: hypothetical protein Q9214_007948, partial [Letrouitia sp. 1 TL-2023]